MASKVELLFLHWKNHLQCFNSSLCAESSQVPSLPSLSHPNSSSSTYKALEPSLSPLPFTCSANEKLSFSLGQSSSSVFLLPLLPPHSSPSPHHLPCRAKSATWIQPCTLCLLPLLCTLACGMLSYLVIFDSLGPHRL